MEGEGSEERGIESGWREGGRKGWGDKWKEEVGRDEGRKGKEGRNNGGRKGRLKSVCCFTTTTVLYHMKACTVFSSVAKATISFQLFW